MTANTDGPDRTGPLSDVRVIDLTVARAGPTCVRQLADWGADVISIDPPTDVGIGLLDWSSPDFQNMHRNKRSLALDLKSPEGRGVLYELVKSADVVVENMRPRVKDRLEIDYARLRSINPRLVYGSISGFGDDGPYADRGGMDQIVQGMSGLMSITGNPGEGPMRVGIPVSDLAAGLYLAIGILVALHERQRTGEGNWVKTSLLESMIAMLDFQAARWTMRGEVASQEGNHHPMFVPMGCFATADAYVNIAGSAGRLWPQLCQALDLAWLVDDRRFLTPVDRAANRHELNAVVQDRLRRETTAHWVDVFEQHQVPAGPVYTIDEVFADPQVQHLAMAETITNGELGQIEIVRNAVSFAAPNPIRRGAPKIGQHTFEVLEEIGLTAERAADLAARGVVRGVEP